MPFGGNIGSGEVLAPNVILDTTDFDVIPIDKDSSQEAWDWLDDFYIEQFTTPPTTPTTTGVKGQLAYDGVYLYNCIATNTWVRHAVETDWV
jgi:hypothetical protein